MENTIKILLTSNIHLGFKSEELNISDEIRENTFRRITDIALKYDLLLISGIFIDNMKNLPENLIKEKFEVLQKNNTKIIYSPYTDKIDIPDESDQLNFTYLFSDKNSYAPYIYKKNESKIFIYGLPEERKLELSTLKKLDEKGFHIGLFHFDFDFRNNINNIKKEDIKNTGLDFFALGNDHKFKIYKTGNKIIAANPGTPEAASPDETGERYLISLIIKNDKLSELKKISINSITIKKLEIELKETDSIEKIIEMTKKLESKDTILYITLKGIRNFQFENKIIEELKEKFHDFILIDDSIKSIKFLLDEDSNENNIQSEFFTLLKKTTIEEKIPENIKIKDLTEILKIMKENDYISLEDFLCTLPNA